MFVVSIGMTENIQEYRQPLYSIGIFLEIGILTIKIEAKMKLFHRSNIFISEQW